MLGTRLRHTNVGDTHPHAVADPALIFKVTETSKTPQEKLRSDRRAGIRAGLWEGHEGEEHRSPGSCRGEGPEQTEEGDSRSESSRQPESGGGRWQLEVERQREEQGQR